MNDADLAAFADRLMREDITPSLLPSPLDLNAYAGETLHRFRNPAIRHKLWQIAWDGSQKLLYRLLDTIREALAAGRPVERLAVPVAAWMLFVERQARAGRDIVDPLAAQLTAIGRGGGDPVPRLLELRQIFPEKLASDSRFRSALAAAAAAMRNEGPRARLSV